MSLREEHLVVAHEIHLSEEERKKKRKNEELTFYNEKSPPPSTSIATVHRTEALHYV